MGQLDERLGETYMSHPVHRLHQDPANGPKAVEELQSLTTSIRDKGEEALREPMMRITFKETSLYADKPTSVGKSA
jgi:hypothetical protein